MTETVEATITDLNALLADDEHDSCTIVAVTMSVKVLRWRIPLRKSGECGRPAVAVVTLSCPEHGRLVRAICRKHLAVLRRIRVTAHCPHCTRPVVVNDHAS